MLTSSDSNIRDQAYQFFIQEAVEFLQTLETGLINLSQDYNIPKVHEIMRAAHSIKGGAASVGLVGIQQLAHQLEDCIRALYSEDVVVNEVLEELLLQAYDCLQHPLIQQIETGTHDPEAALLAAAPIFTQLTEILGDAMQGDAAMPTSAELGIDIVQAIFAGDVGDGLQRLEQVLQSPDTNEVLGELRAQAEVFVGIGELVNLPGWLAIAKAILNALQQNPEQAPAIGMAALQDLKMAQQMILAGDRVQGGSPSAELLHYAAPPTVSHVIADVMTAEMIPNVEWATSTVIREQELVEQALAELPESAFDSLFDLAIPTPAVIPLPTTNTTDQASEIAHWPIDDFSGEAFAALDSFFDAAPPAEMTSPETPDDIYDLATDDAWEDPTVMYSPSLDTAIRQLLEAQDEDEFQLVEPEASIAPPIPAIDAAPDEVTEVLVEANPIPVFDPTIDMTIRDLLQKAESIEIAPPPEVTLPLPAVVQTTAATTPTPDPAANSPTVRVDLTRLDRINNFVGELLTEENRIILQNQQLQTVIKAMTQRFGDFEGIAKEIGTWSDQTQKEYAKLNTRREMLEQIRDSEPSAQLVAELDEAFDPLQMDSYSELYEHAQEMLELIAQMNEGMRDITAITQQVQQGQRQQQQTLKLIRDDLMWARMLPLGDLLQRFPRMLRDLSSRHGKQVSLKLTGAQTLVDKSILQSLYDPLVHLLRNAFDHGVETPATRIAQGKPEQATIEIKAYHRGNQTYIEVSDDGAGIDPEKIKAQIIDRGLLTAPEAHALSTNEIYEYLFTPGFSTAAQVSELSGRGVGLDAVQLQVRNLKGSLSLQSEVAQGTVFTMRLPLTLTIANLLIFSVQSYLLAIPVDALSAIVAAPKQQIRTLRGEKIFQYEDDLVPVYSSRMFLQHYPIQQTLPEEMKAIPLPQADRTPLLLMNVSGQLIALEVDHIMQEQELAIKAFSEVIPNPPHFYGCSILANGLLVPVLDAQALLDASILGTTAAGTTAAGTTVAGIPGINSPEPISPNLPTPSLTPTQSTVLVIDDSLTTRQTLALTLQKAGYRVLQAKDGRDGLEQLQREPQIKAIFSDIEMPRMNGFEFLSQCRQQHKKEALPVIMLTSRGGDRHRQIAQYMGANGYLTKPYLEQEVLRTLQSVMA
jgi:two-component system, chemotaxis family, sensor histidine kinase and response regulator PixL